jgi:hypothetical protein
MRKTLKQTLLAGVGAMALAAGASIGSAHAFDRTHWSFDLRIDPCVDIDVNLDPSSMTTVEADQTSIGDIEAKSIVKYIEVHQPSTGHDDHGDDWGNWGHDDHADSSLDALTQLGSLVSSATAVANNVNATTNTQALFADISQEAKGASEYLWFSSPGDVTAKSIVKDIDNLQIDSSATAVANNVGLTSVVDSLGDVSAVANVTQKSTMNVSALSVVKDVDFHNYSNLGKLTSPAISSVATAVGNNLNVSVTKATTP